MSKRDLSLATRNEHTRNEKEVVLPIQFSRIQIKKHFDDNLDEIKKQFNYSVDRKQMPSDIRIKEIGLHKLILKLHKGINAEIKINVMGV